MSVEKSSVVTVLEIEDVSSGLFKFKTTRPEGFKFEAGQFARLGVRANQVAEVAADQFNPEQKTELFRAYSVVSSPYAESLEFLSVKVPGGAFTERLSRIKVGDQLYLENAPYGFLTLSRYQQPKPQTLWLLASGTGVAPFLSMLQDFYVWENYSQVVLVYSARKSADLAYTDVLEQMIEPFQSGKEVGFKLITVVTQEPLEVSGADCDQRITRLIDSGELERCAELEFSSQDHIMICGNPSMIDEVKDRLKSRGLTMNRRGVGSIAVENYW